MSKQNKPTTTGILLSILGGIVLTYFLITLFP